MNHLEQYQQCGAFNHLSCDRQLKPCGKEPQTLLCQQILITEAYALDNVAALMLFSVVAVRVELAPFFVRSAAPNRDAAIGLQLRFAHVR